MIAKLLYHTSIFLYELIISLLSPFNKKAKQWTNGRKNWRKRYQTLTTEPLDSQISNLQSPVSNLAWFHCASLGEFEQGRPMIEAFRRNFPTYKILLTFFSPSGYEIRKNYAEADFVVYLPADTPNNASDFIEIFKPTLAFFVKYEFWRNYLTELHRRQIPTFAFSVIFRENQIYFKSYGAFFRKILFNFNHIFVQNEYSERLLQSIGYQAVTIAGDTRFDRVKQIVDSVKEIEVARKFKGENLLFIIGSAWQEDLDCVFGNLGSEENSISSNLRQSPSPRRRRVGMRSVATYLYKKMLFPNQTLENLTLNPSPEMERDYSQNSFLPLKYIIAPHEIHESQISAWQQQIPLKSIRFSAIEPHTQLTDYQCLIIDNIGMLSSLYQYADFAFIGGAFGKGLHNILEAATFGMPIFFGNKNYQKFKEATDLVALQGAFAVENSADFQKKLNNLLENDALRLEKSAISSQYVVAHTGATEKIICYLKWFLSK